jgi:hypothetical protein
MQERAWVDPKHRGNKLRPKVRCIGCGVLGCVTYWGPWCFKCNVSRMDRMDGRFANARAALAEREK